MISKSIKKIGIEIESAWLRPELQQHLHDDASFSRADFPPQYKSVGELVSAPMEDLPTAIQWIKNNYPEGSGICPKTAIHIHLEIINVERYSQLMSTKFYEYFLQCMNKWGEDYSCTNEEFWNRLNGKNKYCKREFRPDVQAAMKEKGINNETRRTQLNYPFRLFKTIECRLPPVFKNVKTTLSFLDALINCIEAFLENNPPKEKYIRLEISDNDIDNSLEINNACCNGPLGGFIVDSPDKAPMSDFEKELKLIKGKSNELEMPKVPFNYFEPARPLKRKKTSIPSLTIESIKQKIKQNNDNDKYENENARIFKIDKDF